MSKILHRSIGKPLLVVFGCLFLIAYVYFYPISINQEKPSNPPAAIALPKAENKDLKSACVSEATKYYQDNKSKGLSNQNMIYGINSSYRICLANKGLTPEDLLSYPANQESVGTSGSMGGETSSQTYGTFKQDMSQRCQKEYSEYNTCLNEYNAKMTDYNQCLNYEGGLCFKPSNFCSKPLCPL